MDPELIPVAYDLAGCVNGAPVAVRIEGAIAPREVRFLVPGGSTLLCDAELLALAAIDPAVLACLDPRLVPGDTAARVFRLESGVYDDGEKAVGRFVVSGCWSVEGGRIEVCAQIVEGWLNVEPKEAVTHVGDASSMSFLVDDAKVVATRTWTVGTSRGGSYSGTTVSRGCALADGTSPLLELRWSRTMDGEAPPTHRIAVVGGA